MEAKISMLHDTVHPAAYKPAFCDRASGSQTGLSAALCRAAMAGGSSASGLAVPLHSFTTRILPAQMRQFQRQSTAKQSLTESQLSTASPLMSQMGAATPGDRNPNADLLTSLVGTAICGRPYAATKPSNVATDCMSASPCRTNI